MEKSKKKVPEEMAHVKVSIRKLYTRRAYARYLGLTEARICQLMKQKEIRTIPINGGELIYVE